MDITPLNVQYEDVQDKEAPPSSGLAPEVTLTESSPMASEARVLGRDSPDAVRCTMTQWECYKPFPLKLIFLSWNVSCEFSSANSGVGCHRLGCRYNSSTVLVKCVQYLARQVWLGRSSKVCSVIRCSVEGFSGPSSGVTSCMC